MIAIIEKSAKIKGFIAFLAVMFIFNFQISEAQIQNNCNYTWVSQSSGTLNYFNSVKAVSELVCWAAGSNATIRRTMDGGNTWTNGNPNPGVISGEILYIEATDENNAWVTTTPPSSSTFMYKTTNGGINWTQVYTHPTGKINGIKMISATGGYAFGSPVSGIWNILITSNGGMNWTSLPTSPSAQLIESGFRNGIYVRMPHIWFGSFPGIIYRSTNSGINWTSHTTTGLNGYTFAIHFNSDTLGLASGITMVKSTDTGTTYFPLTVPGAGNINGIDGRDNELWFVRQTQIYRSTDGGSSWTSVHTTSSTMMDIDFPDDMSGCLTGWAVGFGGTIAKMTGTLTGMERISGNIPQSHKLSQNYPNPFNSMTKIQFKVSNNKFVKLSIYDISGREVAILVNEDLQAGAYEVTFNASHNGSSAELSSGVYYYRLVTTDYSETKKMLLTK